MDKVLRLRSFPLAVTLSKALSKKSIDRKYNSVHMSISGHSSAAVLLFNLRGSTLELGAILGKGSHRTGATQRAANGKLLQRNIGSGYYKKSQFPVGLPLNSAAGCKGKRRERHGEI